MAASQSGWEDIVEIMLAKGARVTAMTTGGASPLIQAAYGGNAKVVRILIQHGANMTAGGYSALIEAIKAGKKDVVAVLLVNGVNVNPSEGDSFSQTTGSRFKKGVVSSSKSAVSLTSRRTEEPPSTAPHAPATPSYCIDEKEEEIALLLINNGP
jgi:ankyrin repeat protein